MDDLPMVTVARTNTGRMVLSRREGQEIVISDTHGYELARIEVREIRGSCVRIGIQADGLGIDREEVFQKRKKEGRR